MPRAATPGPALLHVLATPLHRRKTGTTYSVAILAQAILAQASFRVLGAYETAWASDMVRPFRQRGRRLAQALLTSEFLWNPDAALSPPGLGRTIVPAGCLWAIHCRNSLIRRT